MKKKARAYYAEELIKKGLRPNNLPAELAFSIPYDYKIHAGFADILSALGLVCFGVN